MMNSSVSEGAGPLSDHVLWKMHATSLQVFHPIKTGLVVAVIMTVTLLLTVEWKGLGVINPTMLPTAASQDSSPNFYDSDSDVAYSHAPDLSPTPTAHNHRPLVTTPRQKTEPLATPPHPCTNPINLTVLGRPLDRCAASEAVKLAEEEDIYVSIKTASVNHESRILPDLLTWFQTLNPKQIHVVTDVVSPDEQLYKIANETGIDIVTTDCPKIHSKVGLCCKSRNEYFRYFNTTNKSGDLHRWYCHFDDDMYVNIPALVPALREEMNKSADGGVYFGRWPEEMTRSTPNGWRVSRRTLRSLGFSFKKDLYAKWATGAAYCVSSTIMKTIKNILSKHTFEEYCAKFLVSDDVTAAVLVGMAGYVVSDNRNIITHYDKLKEIPVERLKTQITSSHRYANVMQISDSIFSSEQDVTRFLSYHCLLYPSTSWCRKSN